MREEIKSEPIEQEPTKMLRFYLSSTEDACSYTTRLSTAAD